MREEVVISGGNGFLVHICKALSKLTSHLDINQKIPSEKNIVNIK